MWTMPHTRERSHVDDRREALERSNASTRRPRVLLTPANPHRRFEPRVREERLKCEIWEKWVATYGRNGCVGEKKNEPRIREELLG